MHDALMVGAHWLADCPLQGQFFQTPRSKGRFASIILLLMPAFTVRLWLWSLVLFGSALLTN